MGDKTVSVRVRFEGGDQVKAGLQEVGREGTRAMQSVGTVSAQTGAQLQNAGYQVSDFFVQIAGGTAPTRALAQQLPQLLQGFGLIGVAASVLVAALPSLWSLFALGAEEGEDLANRLKEVGVATDAYARAASLAIEPMDKLIGKYGELAESVRMAREQQAELARGEAVRAVNSLLSDTQSGMGSSGADSALLAQAVAVEQGYRRIRDLQAQLTPEQARFFDFSADLAELDRMAGAVDEVRQNIRGIASEYDVTIEQAAILAAGIDRVRDSAGQSAAEQVSAAGALRDNLVEVFGSADAANEATGGLVDRLNAAVIAAADVAATSAGIAGSIGAGADQAARLADNLRAASLNYGKIQNTGQSGPDAARRSVLGLNAPGVITGTIAGGAGGAFVAPRLGRGGGGGGGGGGVDPDIARAKALTEGVRTETERYAIALEEVNRLKEKGLITDETYNRQLEKLGDKMGELGDLGRKAASAIRGAFDNLFDDPAEALKNLSKQLAMMALYSGLAKAFPGAFGAGGAVPLVPGFAAGGRHKGGLRIVGENGPEIEATGPSMIYPNDMLRSMGRRGGGGTVVQINNNTGQPAREERSQGPDGREIVRVIVGEELTRGGLDKPMRSRFAAQPNRMKR